MFSKYLDNITTKLKLSGAGERNYYPIVEELFKDIFKYLKQDYTITIEKTECFGIPDFTITKAFCDIGIIEAKDIDEDIDNIKFQEQFQRYTKSKENVLITNFIEWRWYYKEKELKRVIIGKIENIKDKTITKYSQNYDELLNVITEFLNQKTQITNADILSCRMGLQARLLRDEIIKLFDKPNNTKINIEMETIKKNLKNDITKEEFASIKAQMTIYGIFIAKLYYGDKQKEGFKLERIAENIPSSNSFLQQLFYEQNNPFYMDEKIKLIINRVIEMMAEVDVVGMLDDFAKKNKTSTSIVEFYEAFLEKYDPKLRANMGVWYTPQAIVDFIVRQIDLILINTFKINDGIINTDDIPYNKNGKPDTSGEIVDTQQQVQILDPATGTGTFLVEYIRLAFEKFMKAGKYNQWNNFVEKYLLSNLNAFEVMMCPYVLAHLQIDIILQQFGTNAQNFISKYIEDNNIFPDTHDKKYLLEGFIWKRLCKKDNINEAIEKYSGYHIADKDNNNWKANIYLTNSLDDWNDKEAQTKELYGNIIEQEGTEARKIKKQKHIMVIMGNPPYNASTMNKGKWITKLLDDYKYEKTQDNIINLLKGEKNIKPLSDDYVKFIRYGENYIEKNNRGILAFITNNSYLNGCSHRGMRKHLLKTFDDIYIINLHGDIRRDKELIKNGDQNVFNIMQGVAISIFVKKPHQYEEHEAKRKGEIYAKPLATIHYKDLSGARYEKFNWLNNHNIFEENKDEQQINNNSSQIYNFLENREIIKFDKEWIPKEEDWLFIPKTETNKDEYKNGFNINDCYEKKSMGFSSGKDEINICFSNEEAQKIISDFVNFDNQQLHLKYNVSENIDWNFDTLRECFKTNSYSLINGSYRAFDDRTIIFSNQVGAFARSRYDIMQHFLQNDNIAMLISKSNCDVFVSNKITCMDVVANRSYVNPLYIFTEGKRNINFSQQFIKDFSNKINLPFSESIDKDFVGFKNNIQVSGFYNRYDDKTKFNELHIFDYIYGVLNDKEYNIKYKEFLENDFPKVPYPDSIDSFFKTARNGEIIRHLHLMEIADTDKFACIDFTRIGFDILLNGDYENDTSKNNFIENIKVEKVENLKINSIYGNILSCRVWINKYQYFIIPEDILETKIGSYRPVIEYIKKRKGRYLTEDEKKHFDKICKVMSTIHFDTKIYKY